MSNGSNGGGARYTSFLAAIPAGDVIVPGATPGSTGARGISSRSLSSLAGVFTVGPDTVRLLSPGREPPLRRFMPARPAIFADAD